MSVTVGLFVRKSRDHVRLSIAHHDECHFLARLVLTALLSPVLNSIYNISLIVLTRSCFSTKQDIALLTRCLIVLEAISSIETAYW
jgi:hypothetical protein